MAELSSQEFSSPEFSSKNFRHRNFRPAEFSSRGIFGPPDIPVYLVLAKKQNKIGPFSEFNHPSKHTTSPSFATKPNQNTQPAPHSQTNQIKHTTSPSFANKQTKTQPLVSVVFRLKNTQTPSNSVFSSTST